MKGNEHRSTARLDDARTEYETLAGKGEDQAAWDQYDEVMAARRSRVLPVAVLGTGGGSGTRASRSGSMCDSR